MTTLLSINIERGKIFAKFGCCGYIEFQYLDNEEKQIVLDNIYNSLPEEPVRIKKGCKYRCLSDVRNTDTGAISFFKDKIYSAPEDDTLVSEENGWLCDLSENSSNFEIVEEPVSEDNNLRKASEEYLKVLSETPYNNTPITNAQTIVRELITFMDNPSKYNPNHIEEPVSEDLKEASKEWLRPQLDKSYANYGEKKMMELTRFDGYAMLDAIEFGAKWKEQQFEKNRLKHCDTITNEQAELEQGFIDQHYDKYNRLPTFLDAIKYGMRLKEKQLMKGAKNGVVCDGNDYIKFDDGTWIELDPTMQLNPAFALKDGDKVKVIVLKEK